MTDRYSQIVNAPLVRNLAGSLGLPQPIELERHEPGGPLVAGEVLLGAAPGGGLIGEVARALAEAGAAVQTEMRDEVRKAAGDAGLDAAVWSPDAPDGQRFKALVFDASGISSSSELRELWAFFSPAIRRVAGSGRVIVLGTPPGECPDPASATAQRALEGFTRSVGKEVRRGATSQLVYVDPGAGGAIDSTLRFFLSPRSAFVSGQVVRVGAAGTLPKIDWERPLAGSVALVTGAARGIGASIARVLARDGAEVVGVDVPPLAAELEASIEEIGGSSLVADITEADSPQLIADQLSERHGGVDAVVHNAGITRDKTLGRMDSERWTKLLEVNLTAPERINDALLSGDVLRKNGRLIGVSSISGIAGNAGQSNYATSKAGVIGMVESMAPVVAERDATINAVAPGFIETQMTAAMPLGTREVGRRLNSLSQGGLPLDVAETIAWLASPASGGLNGNVVRVCGQSLIGA